MITNSLGLPTKEWLGCSSVGRVLARHVQKPGFKSKHGTEPRMAVCAVRAVRAVRAGSPSTREVKQEASRVQAILCYTVSSRLA